jgi:putative spermidine/putrescine transport system ATP-binding protein
MAFLTLENLYKTYGSVNAVENFNLEVEKGEFISFLGPSGCGKTTTLRMIGGFETPTSGTIKINGEDLTNKPINKRNIGMVFQSYALFPNMNVGANIGFGLKVAKEPPEVINERVKEMLNIIHMSEFMNRYPYQLSGGQQQRVALARALAIQPQVLLLDEPLSALDAKIRLELRTEIRAIQQKLGITTIYVTHDQEEALSLSDRVVVMRSGQMEQVGTPFDIYNFPSTPFVAGFVGTLNVLNAKVVDVASGKVSIDEQVIKTTQPLRSKAGEVIKLALRPEILSLLEENGSEVLKGKVESVTFLGAIVRIQVQLGDNRFFFDLFNKPHLILPKIDEVVNIYFPPEACLLLGEYQPKSLSA